MAQKKVYDKEFKVQTVKLGREIGFSKAGGAVPRFETSGAFLIVFNAF